MKKPIDEWLEKAETDFKGALVLMKASDTEFFDLVCYHCQQSAEKILKAFLTSLKSSFPKTHDLYELLNLALSHQQDLEFIAEEFYFLNRFSVTVRYPGDHATKEEANDAIKAIKTIRKVLLDKLGKTTKRKIKK